MGFRNFLDINREYTHSFLISFYIVGTVKLPMPPYAVFKVEPVRWYVPKIENGVNKRMEVVFHRGDDHRTV